MKFETSKVFHEEIERFIGIISQMNVNFYFSYINWKKELRIRLFQEDLIDQIDFRVSDILFAKTPSKIDWFDEYQELLDYANLIPQTEV